MEPYTTEEQQVEAIKNWFKANGSSLVTGIVLTLLVVFGWKFWQQSTVESGEAASMVYKNMMEAAQMAFNDQDQEENLATASHLAQQLIDEHRGSQYAHFAALTLAKIAVINADYVAAEEQLNWVISQRPDKPLLYTAQLRLARVLAEQGEVERGLAVVDKDVPVSMQASFEEMKGDLYLLLGDNDNARTAYEKAAKAASDTGGPSATIQIKLDDLAPIDDDITVAEY
ncbi:MAG TPA: tetratricopeptide repeat protein [Pseudomonadales bacterium]